MLLTVLSDVFIVVITLCIQNNGDYNVCNNLYSFYSPSGKLVQIEYALAAVSAGAASVGIKGLYTKKFLFFFTSYLF